jgi:hypothetical protein
MVADMESESHRDGTAKPQDLPSPSEAREMLSGLEVDSSTLSARVVTPGWYHLVLGIIMALLVGSQVLPVAASGVLLAVGFVAIPVLMITYARRYGVSIVQPAGPRSRRLLLTTVGVPVLGMIASMVIKIMDLAPSWGLIPAALAFALTIVLARRYGDALQDDVAGISDKNR